MRDFVRGLIRRVEEFFFVLDLTRLQAWRRSTPTLQEQEEQRRNRERFEATLDQTASF